MDTIQQIDNADVQLENLRNAKDRHMLVDAVSILCLQLVDSDQRSLFRRCDGTTAIVNNLKIILDERASNVFMEESTTFGFTLKLKTVDKIIKYLIVCVCHMALDEEMSRQLGEVHAINILTDIAQSANEKHTRLALEALRNLFHLESNRGIVSTAALDFLWKTALNTKSEDSTRELALLNLCNIAADTPVIAQATEKRLITLCRLFFKSTIACLRIASADLLCNLARDTNYSIIIISELEEMKPLAAGRQSCIVYLMDLSETYADMGLRNAIQAVSHNLVYAELKNKNKVERLGTSYFIIKYFKNIHVKPQST